MGRRSTENQQVGHPQQVGGPGMVPVIYRADGRIEPYFGTPTPAYATPPTPPMPPAAPAPETMETGATTGAKLRTTASVAILATLMAGGVQSYKEISGEYPTPSSIVESVQNLATLTDDFSKVMTVLTD